MFLHACKRLSETIQGSPSKKQIITLAKNLINYYFCSLNEQFLDCVLFVR